jgi:hypothetical protein
MRLASCPFVARTLQMIHASPRDLLPPIAQTLPIWGQVREIRGRPKGQATRSAPAQVGRAKIRVDAPPEPGLPA